MYSLGVIFFEMCHPPPSTEMERQQLLTALRKDQPELPTLFSEYKMKKKVCPPHPLPHPLPRPLPRPAVMGRGTVFGVQLLIAQYFCVLHNSSLM